jgi:hypothetical protein
LVNRLVDPTDFPYTADYDAQDRVKCFDPPGGHPSGGYDHTLGTILLGRQLQRYVEGSGGFLEQVEPVPSGKIDIVAHSFGGLVSRWYIEEVKGGAAPVSSLTMLGTPNRGTPLADWAVRLDMLDFVREDQAAWDMRLDSNDPGSVVDHLLYYVNNGFVMPAATTYRVEVGTWSAPAWDLILGRPNDCVVSASSARGPFPGVAQERLVSHRGTCTAAAGGLLDDASSNCSTDPGHVFCDVNDMLEIPITAGVTATLQALTLLAQIAPQATSSPWEPSPQSGMASGQVGPGEVNEHLAQIDASAATADFALFWAYESSPSALRLTLETPTGSIIDSSAPGVTHSPAAEIADGYMVEEYHVDTPEVGQWVMRVEGVSVPPEGQAYAVVAVMDSPVTLSASVTPDSISPGETLTLAAELSQPAGPILGATITVSITKPDGSGGAVTLLDDGSGGDSQANDGIYSGAFGDTSACGAYSLAFHVEGTAASGSFERDESTAILAHVTEDAVGDPCNRDDDDDHMPDDYELANLCLDPVVGDGSEDPDADGLANFGEMTLGTDPCSYDPWLADDGDGDGFTDGVEQCLGTDPLDACPDNPSDDAWPLDIDMNGDLSVTGDVFYYRGRIGATPSDPEWWQRLDLDMNGDISVTGDVFMYRGRIGETCT